MEDPVQMLLHRSPLPVYRLPLLWLILVFRLIHSIRVAHLRVAEAKGQNYPVLSLFSEEVVDSGRAFAGVIPCSSQTGHLHDVKPFIPIGWPLWVRQRDVVSGAVTNFDAHVHVFQVHHGVVVMAFLPAVLHQVALTVRDFNHELKVVSLICRHDMQFALR
eukprot:3940065-Rhodomonas_salina.1